METHRALVALRASRHHSDTTGLLRCRKSSEYRVHSVPFVRGRTNNPLLGTASVGASVWRASHATNGCHS